MGSAVHARLFSEFFCCLDFGVECGLWSVDDDDGTDDSALLGDNYFSLACKRCTPANIDVVKRDKVNWLQALVLALYNLKNQNPELAREDYFHWKVHVASFLENNWISLFGPQ